MEEIKVCAACVHWHPRDTWQVTSNTPRTTGILKPPTIVIAQGDCSCPEVAGKYESVPKMNYKKACKYFEDAMRGHFSMVELPLEPNYPS